MAAFPHRISSAAPKRITAGPEFRCGDTCFISTLAREHRRLMQKGAVVDLPDEEIRHVGRKTSAAAACERDLHAVCGASTRAHKLLPAGPAAKGGAPTSPAVVFARGAVLSLSIVVVIEPPQQKGGTNEKKKPATAAAV